MGWFDSKSWRLRRKIKDLQADLRAAEKEGKYVVEGGLFFAELEDMGEMTMMVFGSSDQLATTEESIIRTFFDRNGFTVATVKLDKAHTHLAEVEIIPPEEMTRHVGRSLKASGYRLIDDSETERPAEQARKIFPLSTLIRSITLMFAEHVQKVIATTHIKMNKEGNRLLHWMPRIVEALSAKVQPWAVEEARAGFIAAYEQFYGGVGQREGFVSPTANFPTPSQEDDEHAATQRIPAMEFPSKATTAAQSVTPPIESPKPAPPPALTPPPMSLPLPRKSVPPPVADEAARPGVVAPAAAPVSRDETVKFMRGADVAESISRMYKSLVKATPNRCIKNAEALLEEVNRLFNASATSLMVKVPNGQGLTIHAQAGKRLTWGEDGGPGYPVSTTVMGNCIKHRTAVTNTEDGAIDPTASMLSHKIDAAAAAPIVIQDEIVGILYIDRRGGVRHFSQEDCETLEKCAQVFREFPDLTLGMV